MIKNKIIELLAPAGNLEKAKTAFAFGADAVYCGIPDFSLRVRINAFTINKIKTITNYAHKLDKKVYITVNIFTHNKHIKKLPEHIKKLKQIGVDGIFISDPAVLQIIKKIWPKAKIILSTQANCTNWQTAKYWYDQGVNRVILSRELTIKEIAEIHQRVPKLEIECFVHGALCMAYSGRCFLSKFFTERNANLGDCIQPCRWQYNVQISEVGRSYEKLELVEEKHGSYILNSKDLCLIKRLGELMKAGISGFKIEGRAKSTYYLATVIGAYRRAIDLLFDNKISKKEKAKEIDFLYKELKEKLYHRGYTEGFMFNKGKLAQNLDNSHNKCNWEFCGTVVNNANLQIHANTANSNNANPSTTLRTGKKNKKIYDLYIKVHNSIKVGDKIEIVMPIYDIIKMKVNRLVDRKTGEEIMQAHGGQGKIIILESSQEIPRYSVIRRKIV